MGGHSSLTLAKRTTSLHFTLSAARNFVSSSGEAPPAIRQKIHAAAVATLHSKEVVDAYAAVGGVVVGGTSAELTTFLASESAKWSEVIRFAKVKLE